MSDVAAAIEALFGVLEEERQAIRRLDGTAVERAATEKASLAATLAGAPSDALSNHEAAVRRLRAELRRNGVLLAHARSCLQHAIDLLHPREGDARRGVLRASL